MKKICKNCVFWKATMVYLLMKTYSVDFGYCEKLKGILTIYGEEHQINPDTIGTPDIFSCNLFKETNNG